MIVNRYAFTRYTLGYKVLNLNRLDSVAVISMDGTIIETSMDGIKFVIIKSIFYKDRKYMED
ncbi:hypothetical protein P261_00073 [Lachnospiraceae bacterium TWA4]|nr:hypothetical protein P261_00073 [Lachnospiraceae bacterium TWA4]